MSKLQAPPLGAGIVEFKRFLYSLIDRWLKGRGLL
jgi:hypothetical protein